MSRVDKCIKLKISDFDHMPEESGSYDIMLNKYWIVTEDECVLLYNGYSFQCNDHEQIVESILKLYPNCVVRQIPLMIFVHGLR